MAEALTGQPPSLPERRTDGLPPPAADLMAWRASPAGAVAGAAVASDSAGTSGDPEPLPG